MPMQSHAQFVCVITLITCVLVVIVTADGMGMHEWSLVHAEPLHIPHQGNCRCELSAHLLHPPPRCRARHGALRGHRARLPARGCVVQGLGCKNGEAGGSCGFLHKAALLGCVPLLRGASCVWQRAGCWGSVVLVGCQHVGTLP